MKLRAGTEVAVYAAAYAAEFARLHANGVHAQFRLDVERGHITQDQIVPSWELWCAEMAIDWAEATVALHRKAMRSHDSRYS